MKTKASPTNPQNLLTILPQEQKAANLAAQVQVQAVQAIQAVPAAQATTVPATVGKKKGKPRKCAVFTRLLSFRFLSPIRCTKIRAFLQADTFSDKVRL